MTAQEKVRRMNADKGRENRKNGEAFEIRCLMKVKRMSGCLNACRASGSRGLFDITAMYSTHVKCIIVKKNGYVEPAEKKKIARFFRQVRASETPVNYKIEIWWKDEVKRRICKKRIQAEYML